jgi:hypothetical protein
MIAVAVVGCTLSLGRLWQKVGHMRAHAALHARAEREALAFATDAEVNLVDTAMLMSGPSPWEPRMSITQIHERASKLAEQMRASWWKRATYHAALRRKYERAARYPWLPVEPDPPEPQ